MINGDEMVVRIEGLSRRFGRKVALDEVSLDVPRGCVYGLVGANGAGKTTLLRHLLGLLKAQTGTVRVFDRDPVRETVPVLSRIGYLSEERDLPEWMRVCELMRYAQAYHPSWDETYADELVRDFGLDLSAKIKDLSRGQRAQAGLIAAVAHRPDLLVLDEPSSGLDPIVRRDILSAVVRAVADGGRTVLFSSHLLDEVEQLSDHMAMLDAGHVILQGPLDALKERHLRIEVLYDTAPTSPPSLPGALSLEGSGRTWAAVCNGALDDFRRAVTASGGRIVGERGATLEEIFVARVGRKAVSAEE